MEDKYVSSMLQPHHGDRSLRLHDITVGSQSARQLSAHGEMNTEMKMARMRF